jgi:hypothetical protein
MPAPAVVIDELVVKQVAALAISGASPKAIADELGITPYQARKILASDNCKQLIKTVGDEALAQAKSIIRTETSKLAVEVMRALRAKLAKDDLDAVKVALRVLGLDQPEEKDTGNTHISVVLPGQSQPAKPDIEVTDYGVEIQDDTH